MTTNIEHLKSRLLSALTNNLSGFILQYDPVIKEWRKTNMMKIQDKYTMIRPLGKGIQGFVFLGEDRETNKIYAIKGINYVSYIMGRKKDKMAIFLDNTVEEINNLYELKPDNEYTVTVENVYIDSGRKFIYIVMEYLEGDELKDVDYKELNIKQLWKIYHDLIYGLDYIHSKNIAHKDIKEANLIMDIKTNTFKYVDFGLSCSKQVCMRAVGTPLYLSPESFDSKNKYIDLQHAKKQDIWALGVVLYNITNNKTFANFKSVKGMINYYEDKQYFGIKEIDGGVMKFDSTSNKYFNTIIEKCLTLNAVDRADIAELKTILDNIDNLAESELVRSLN